MRSRISGKNAKTAVKMSSIKHAKRCTGVLEEIQNLFFGTAIVKIKKIDEESAGVIGMAATMMPIHAKKPKCLRLIIVNLP